MRKKNLAALICVLCIILPSCSRVQRVWKSTNITGEALQEQCPEPVDYHLVHPTAFGTEIRLLRLKDCLEFEHLLVVIWFGEDREVNELAAKLVALMYVDSLNISNKQQLARAFLKKTELVNELRSSETHMLVFELIPLEEERGGVKLKIDGKVIER